MRSALLLAFCAFFCITVQAQTRLDRGDLAVPSLISPYYFGPNAFPIPDVIEGRTNDGFRLEIGTDYFSGYQGDKTTDIYFKFTAPLFSERVNLSIWMPIYEWWTTTEQRVQTCRVSPNKARKGSLEGDVYLSTDIWLLQAQKYGFDMSLRAAMKTASGGSFESARYYDSPGYFFDTSLSKAFEFGGNFVQQIRLSLSTGFLCWQTNNGRQNDALMYGFVASLRTKYFTLKESFGGYMGWEKFAAKDKSIYTGDCPMSLKSDIIVYFNSFELIFRYQVGIKDYPFNQFRIGLAWNIN